MRFALPILLLLSLLSPAAAQLERFPGLRPDPGLPPVLVPEAVYRYNLALEPETGTFRGDGTITVRNRTAHPLTDLHLFLLPNAFTHTSAEGMETEHLDGPARLTIDSLQRNGVPIAGIESDSLLIGLPLDPPLEPGESLTIRVGWHGTIPEGSGGFAPCRDERRAQWFGVWPRVVPPSRGDRLPKTATAFLGDPSEWEIRLRLPADWLPAVPGLTESAESDGQANWLIRPGLRTDLGLFTGKGYRADSRQVALPSGKEINLTVASDSLRPIVRQLWLDVAADILIYYDRMLGPPPGDIAFFEGGFLGGIATDGSILLSDFLAPRRDDFPRLAEAILAHEIAHQWWGVLAQADEAADTWLNESFATWSAWDYLTDTYGPQPHIYPLSQALWFLTDLDDRDIYGLLYTITAGTGDGEPVWTPEKTSTFSALETVSKYYKGAQVLWLLRDRVGKVRFEGFLREWGSARRIVETQDFRLLAARHFPEIPPAFWTGWLETGGWCDPQLDDLTAEALPESTGVWTAAVRLSNCGPLAEPLDLAWLGERETLRTRAPAVYAAHDTTVSVRLPFRPRRVIADPDGHLPDPWRIDNRTPREWRTDLLIDWPDLERYQVFVIPYANYGKESGFRPGFALAGGYLWDAEPALPVPGQHNFLALFTYPINRKRLDYTLFYGTPLIRSAPLWRIDLRAESGSGIEVEEAGTTLRFGKGYYPGLSHSAGNRFSINLRYRRERVFDMSELNPAVWTLGRAERGLVETEWYRRGASGGVAIAAGADISGCMIDGEAHAVREWGSLTLRRESAPLFTGIRGFVGTAQGEPPSWLDYFWSGDQRTLPATYLFMGQTGWFSPTGKVHLSGNGNLLGYQSNLPRSRALAALNMEIGAEYARLPLGPGTALPLRFGVFADAGWPGESAATLRGRECYGDAGFSLAVGPLSGYFPLWIGRPPVGDKAWAFRWLLTIGGYF